MFRARAVILPAVVALLLVAILAATTVLFSVMKARGVEQEQLEPDLLVFKSAGGNTTVLTTSDGLMVVDTKFPRFSERVKTLLAGLDRPVKYVVNTHHHWDHVSGNGAFLAGATLVTTIHAADLLRREGRLEGNPAPQVAAFDEKDHRLRLGPHLIHAVKVGRGHTGGDCVVYFPAQRVVVAGDLFFNGYYPYVDHASGGSYLDWIGTIDHILALGPSRIVPGHGDVTEPAELKAFQGYLRDLVAEVARLKSSGRTKDQVMREIRLPVHEARLKPLEPGILAAFFQPRELHSSLALNAADVYDELEAGGKVPERPVLEVEALDGEPEEAGEGEEKEGSSVAAPAVEGEAVAPVQAR